MTGAPVDDQLLAKYLRLLGVVPRPPGPGLLREVVAAHLERVPFENVSKLYRWQRFGQAGVPDLGLFLEGIEEHGFGGTCYAIGSHLHGLLAALGFDATLCGADMAKPNVHAVVRVRLDGRELLVDAGYAAPFREPLPADVATEHVVSWGRDRYVVSPKDELGRTRVTLHRDGAPKHGYLVNPEPRSISDFAGAVADSFRPEATFRNALLLARFGLRHSVVVSNFSVVTTDASGSSVRRLRDRGELARTIETHFGIAANLLGPVLAGLPALVDPWAS